MVISLYRIDTDAPFSDFEDYLKLISPLRRLKISAMGNDKDKIRSLFSEIVMRREIESITRIPFSEIEFKYNKYGKPYIERGNFHFSISHSGNLIAFVSHSNPVGLDIQKIENVISPAIRFFTQNEKNYTASDPLRFFEIWTKKEAYIKMLGTGLSTPLSSFDVLQEPIKSMLFSTQYEDFFISVCADNVSQIDTQIKYV